MFDTRENKEECITKRTTYQHPDYGGIMVCQQSSQSDSPEKYDVKDKYVIDNSFERGSEMTHITSVSCAF